MDRDPPTEVKRLLRREVNFGCPVPDCGEPFLSWHHFDPPWREREHHEASGMIALCLKHHKWADGGIFSRGDLRRFKAEPLDRSGVVTHFPWLAKHMIVRLGGCYAADSCALEIMGKPVLVVCPGADGMLSVNLDLENEQGEALASMIESGFRFSPDAVHDLEVSVSARRVKLWLEERKLGFECEFTNRKLADFERMLVADQSSSLSALPEWVSPPQPITDFDAFYSQLRELPDLASASRFGMQRSDTVGTVVRWHAVRHLDEDGTIPVLDFVSCRLQHSGRLVEMRNGRIESMHFCAANRFKFSQQGFSMS